MKNILDFVRTNLLLLIVLATVLILSFITLKVNKNYEAESEIWKAKYESESKTVQMLTAENKRFAQAANTSLSRADFKQLFGDEMELFSKKFNLKQINHYTELQTTTTNHIQTTLRDSLVSDTTHVKAFSYTTPNFTFWGYTSGSDIMANWQHRLQLQIATGKQARRGFWNKVLLRPLKREKIVQAVASDSNTVIDNIISTEIH